MNWVKQNLSFLILIFPIFFNHQAFAENKIDSLEWIIKKNTEAIGGKKAWNKINTAVRIRGGANMVTISKRDVGNAVLLFDTTKWKLRFAEGSTETYHWEQYGADSARRIVKGRPDTAMWQTRQSPIYYHTQLYKIRKLGHKIEYLGREIIDSINYYVIQITLTNGHTSGYWYINPNTFLIERNMGFRRHHAYQENIRHIETVWKDFRKVGDVIVPFIEQERDVDTGEILSGGKPSLSIVFNIPIDDEDMTLNGRPEKWMNYLKDTLQKRKSGELK